MQSCTNQVSMNPVRIAMVWLALAVCTAAAAAQTPEPKKPPTRTGGTVAGPARKAPVSRELTKEQVEERLESTRNGLLQKVMPKKYRGKASAERKWLRKFQAVQSDHYLLFTNGPTATCKKFAVTLEDLYGTIKKALPFKDRDHLLVCYIFKSKEEYYQFCTEVTGWTAKQAEGTAGHANANYYATYYQSPRAPVVYHEATHQVVGACLRVTGVGSWFQEGMAVYFEKILTNGKPEADMRQAFKRGEYYSLPKFMALKSLLFDEAGNGRRSYAHSGAIVDFMLNTKLDPVKGKFEEFLAQARKGRGFGRGLKTSTKLVKDVYGLSLEEFEALWKRHLGVR